MSDNEKLEEFLRENNLLEAKQFLIEHEILYESLRFLSKEDIAEAIKPIGLRARFREKLFAWRKKEFGDDDETVSISNSIANKVVSWLGSQSSIASSTPTLTSTNTVCSQLSKNLKLIVSESLKGRAILDFYDANSFLIESFRADLINIILDDILFSGVKLSPKDFPPILEEIINLFPTESKEYYYNPRGIKKNPGGKLFDKYINQKAKRAKKDTKVKSNEPSTSKDPTFLSSGELDEQLLSGLKLSLQRHISDWEEVEDKWQRTFLLRQKEIQESKTNVEFLADWPLFTNPKSRQLINIDFDLLHPNKGHLLFSKWEDFKTKIKNYYHSHINDKKSREIFLNSGEITDQDSLDYILTLLLNAVILPTARFTNKSEKLTKKITIPDANESFIIHLTSINDYERAISDIRNKYYSRGLTIQPFVVVVGLSIYQLKEFYIYFDKTLLKFDNFITSLDTCFKLIFILSLEYPKGCRGPWNFIQEYFFEIPLLKEYKLPSICSLLNFLKT